jgi:hypothetical protein
MQLLGSGKVPLSYVIRTDAIAVPGVVYATEQAHLVVLAPLNVSSF